MPRVASDKLYERYQKACRLIGEGMTANRAAQACGWKNYGSFLRILQTHPEWRPEYESAKRVRTLKHADSRPIDDMSLEDFRSSILGRKTYLHQRQWVEWMESDARRILIQTCPDSAKTTTVKDYLLYRIAREPTIRIGYMTHSHEVAKGHVDSLRLTIEENLMLREVAGDLTPESGDSRPWSAGRFMVGQRSFDAGQDQADATLKAFGHKSQLAGSRLDILVVDDVDAKDDISPADRLEIFDRLMTIGRSRLGVAGKMIVICNRWDLNDVAGLIEQRALEKPGFWKVFKTPAVIRDRDKREAKDWGEVIWPERFGTKTGNPEDRWSKKRAWQYFEEVRYELGPRKFALMYQCDPSQDQEQEFSESAIQAALERGLEHSVGERPADAVLIGALDPAGETGGAAAMALALLPDGRVLISDARWATNVGHTGLLEWMSELGKYQPRYWALETQGGFSILKDDAAFKKIAAAQHASLLYLHTNQNKLAEGVGVTSLGPVIADQLIIPNRTREDQEAMERFVSQLRAYRRQKWDGTRWIKPYGAFDLVMVFWLAMRIIRERGLIASTSGARDRNFWKPPYQTGPVGAGWTRPA